VECTRKWGEKQNAYNVSKKNMQVLLTSTEQLTLIQTQDSLRASIKEDAVAIL
jgi:hypothetical protein